MYHRMSDAVRARDSRAFLAVGTRFCPTYIYFFDLMVQFARASSLLVAVKCGGHSPSGKSTCERGMLIDMSLMRGVDVDPRSRIARVGGGRAGCRDPVGVERRCRSGSRPAKP
jgi:hypothetical protein